MMRSAPFKFLFGILSVSLRIPIGHAERPPQVKCLSAPGGDTNVSGLGTDTFDPNVRTTTIGRPATVGQVAE
jgi:hypothetical protein